MNTATTLRISSISSDATEKLGEALGHRLKGGEVIELVSDLGGGKTTFVRGLARGMGSGDHVTSPTFTISQIYRAGELELHHYDFYRLSEAGVVGDELLEDIGKPGIVTVIEWGGVVHTALPAERLTIAFRRVDENQRELIVSYTDALSYLVGGLA